jgi:predicted MFS family arabinose efflux permease
VGTAVGIAAMGSGVAAIVMPLSATWIIHTFGLSASFWFQVAIALVVGLIVLLALRNRPSDLGLEPYVSEADRNPSDAGHPKVHVGAVKPLSPRAHRAMFVAMVCMGCAGVGGMTYLAILMTTCGFEPYFVASVLTVGGVALTMSKGATGVVFDAVGTRRGSAFFFALFIAGLVLCCLAGTGNHVLMLAGALLYFTGSALATVGVSVWSLDLSTPADRPKLVKDLQIAYALGSLIFCFLPGPLMDLTGTYVISYIILAILGSISCAVVLGIYVRKGPSTAGRRR